MKELNLNETKAVTGGLGILGAIALTMIVYDFGKGFIDGYNS